MRGKLSEDCGRHSRLAFVYIKVTASAVQSAAQPLQFHQLYKCQFKTNQQSIMSTFQLNLNRREYGYCYCVKCIGSLRSKRTVKAHAGILQRPLNKNYRICHCSEHPLGRMVHRHTLRRHINSDNSHGITFKLSPDLEGLAELMDDAVDLQQIEDIRAATHLTQMLSAFDDDDDDSSEENRDEDSGDMEIPESTEDADEAEETERMDEIEELQAQHEGLDFKELPTGKINVSGNYSANYTDINLLIDWIKFCQGVTRAKRLELKALFEEHFPHVILPPIWRLNDKLEIMLHLQPKIYHCCVNSCQAYTRDDEDAEKCRFCGTDRYYPLQPGQKARRPMKEWVFFPLIPRLILQYKGARAQELTEYRASFDNARASYCGWRDIFDGDLYQDMIDPALVDRSLQREIKDDDEYGPMFTE